MQIAVVGSINTDLTIQVPHFSQRNETVVGTGDYVVSQGGKGANQAAAAAAAGADVVMIGKIGTDPFGKMALESLKRAGVNCDNISQSREHSTGLASILLDGNGDNSITVAPGANGAVTPDDVRKAEAAIAAAGILVVQLEVPNAAVNEAVRLAHQHGTIVILNPAPAHPEGLDCLDMVDYATPNEIEAAALTGVSSELAGGPEKIAELLRGKGVKNVALTLGARGCFIAGPDVHDHIAAHSVETVDTTGAGDVFTGYLAASLARGMGFREATQVAVAAAALSVMRAGARSDLPRWDDVQAFMNA
ncbi:MAG: ribokinase [Proteobacteria bacterium]|nr:ribokinase [Pseudomonadota bacterium]